MSNKVADPKYNMIDFIWNEESHFLTIIPPDDGPEKQTNIIAVVDVSGSMNNTVSIKQNDTASETNYTVLDLVKYSLKVVSKSLSPDDTFGLVTFNGQANTIIDPAKVSEIDDIDRRIDDMRATGLTNLWAGVRTAIQLAGKTNTTIMVFTDGCPNEHPPRGYTNAYQSYKLEGGGSIHTFGFGMHLDVDILFTMSQHYNGTYNYISDSSMIGTTFCYTVANIKSEITDNVCIVGQGASIGHLCYGQRRHVMLPERPQAIKFSDGTVYSNITDGPIEDYNFHSTRYIIGEFLLKIVDQCRSENYDKGLIVEDFSKIKALADHVYDLSQDVNGELLKAIENMDMWGRYYIPALFCCHERERANNFMDKGTQRYATGPVFTRFITRAEKIFDTLPPQTPTGYRIRSNSLPAIPVASMSQAFMSTSNGCVSGTTPVLTKERGFVPICEIKVGDILVGDGNDENVVSHVVVGPGAYMLNLTKRLHITEWHPIDTGEGWEFPRNILDYPGAVSTEYFFDTWNLVTTSGKFKTTMNRWVIALGHGIKNDHVASHPYLGSKNVVSDLDDYYNHSTGRCEISGFMRNQVTGLLCGIYNK